MCCTILIFLHFSFTVIGVYVPQYCILQQCNAEYCNTYAAILRCCNTFCCNTTGILQYECRNIETAIQIDSITEIRTLQY